MRLPYNIETVCLALSLYKHAGLIKEWNYRQGSHFEVEMTHGRLVLRSLREAYIFVNGLASASHAMKAGKVQLTEPVPA